MEEVIKNMRKKIILVIVIVLILGISVILMLNVNKKNLYKNTNMNIKDYNFKTFELTNYLNNQHYNNYNEFMTFINNMYYLKINNYDEYLKHKNICTDILEMSEEDFKDNFMIIIAIENTSVSNLNVEEIYINGDTLYVGLKKQRKENSEECKGISISVNRKLEREKIEIFKTITDREKLDSYKIKDIQKKYSKEQAIKDKCVILSSGENTKYYDEFIDKVNNKKDAYIRIIIEELEGSNELKIIDILYLSEKDKFLVCEDETRRKNVNNKYNYYEYNKMEINKHNNRITYVFSNNELDEEELSIYK